MSFLLGISFINIYEKNKAAQIHKNQRSIDIESHRFLMIVRLRNHEIHHSPQPYL